VLLFSFVLFRENLFEPLRLVLSAPFIRKRRLVTDELLAATVTPHDAQALFESRRLSLLWPFFALFPRDISHPPRE
jgi:hypothetical protein